MWICVFVCFSVFLSFCPPLFSFPLGFMLQVQHPLLPVCFSVRVLVCLSICLWISSCNTSCRFVGQFASVSVCLSKSVCLPFIFLLLSYCNVSSCLSTCVSIYLSFCLSVCLSDHLPIYIFFFYGFHAATSLFWLPVCLSDCLSCCHSMFLSLQPSLFVY